MNAFNGGQGASLSEVQPMLSLLGATQHLRPIGIQSTAGLKAELAMAVGAW